MVAEAIITLSSVAAIGSIINLYMDIRNNQNKSSEIEIPMSSYTEGSIPIITLTNNGTPFNFIVDTGSNISHVRKDILEHMEVVETKEMNQCITGLGGSINNNNSAVVNFKDCGKNEYSIELTISDNLGVTLDDIGECLGLKLSGILGTDFLHKFGYKIDFKKQFFYVQNKIKQ